MWNLAENSPREGPRNSHLRFIRGPAEPPLSRAIMGFLFLGRAVWTHPATATADAYITRRYDRILDAYGNHPSFGFWHTATSPAAKKRGISRQTGGTLEGKDHAGSIRGRRVADRKSIPCNLSSPGAFQLRRQADALQAEPFASTSNYRDYVQQWPVPVVSHEIGQWCVFPNLKEIDKYTGPLKPRNFEIVRDLLEAQGMLDQAEDFLMASGKLQTLCYKEEIEAALRTPGFGGFQLLDLHDFPGQGTAWWACWTPSGKARAM